MVGIYLSGTGNTKYCIEKLVSLIHSSAKAIPMESPEAISAIQQNEEIYIGYPTQFSNAPYMVRDFIKKNADIWKNKKILCIATMGAFSGDGAGCTTRMLKRLMPRENSSLFIVGNWKKRTRHRKENEMTFH